MYKSTAMNEYKQVGTKVAAETADPHHLIQLLMNGFVEKVNTAKYHMNNKDIAAKGENISRAIAILDGLKVSLDMNKGGDIANNLSSLYEYMQRKLLMSNVKDDTANLDEVISLMNEIREGWNAIPQTERKAFAAKN
jgi:flagellar secretion chaperone FliS